MQKFFLMKSWDMCSSKNILDSGVFHDKSVVEFLMLYLNYDKNFSILSYIAIINVSYENRIYTNCCLYPP